MDLQTITFEVDGNVATTTLNRPDSMNSINDAMANEMVWAWETLRDTDGVHAVLLQAK